MISPTLLLPLHSIFEAHEQLKAAEQSKGLEIVVPENSKSVQGYDKMISEAALLLSCPQLESNMTVAVDEVRNPS